MEFECVIPRPVGFKPAFREGKVFKNNHQLRVFVLRHVQDLTSGGFRRDDDLWNSNTSTENGCEKDREKRRARKWVVIVIYYINFHPARNGTSNKNETKDKVYLVFSV